ncbi:MAG: response regulator [Myxococcales bacterium]|nr:response regulator [Myxococcales bacterium]
MSSVERLVGGKYRLERQIGGGGMGTIWVALDQRLQRRVALKMMRPDHLRSDSMRLHFEREAQAAARIEHPNVVHIFDYGLDEIDGQAVPYIVMELLSGEDLEARLQRQSKLPLSAVIEIIAQAARALGAAHGAGLVHRDLKPGNLFLSTSEGRDVVKILDFGIAAFRAGERALSEPSYLMGTPHYMSPEQIQTPSSVDGRSDLFALAVVAYQMLTGRLPFEAPSLPDLLICITQPGYPVPAPSQYVPEAAKAGISSKLDKFFRKALARDPSERFQSAREFAAALLSATDSGSPAQTVKILVVDDEADMQLLMTQSFRTQIRRRQYEFTFATDGNTALKELERRPDLDLILSDINMPGMDGLTLLQQVGQVNPQVKVVMVSAYGDMRNIREAMNRGAFDFVTKPIDFKDLAATIDKTAQHAQAAKQSARWGAENALLRMYVNSGLSERLLPMLKGDGVVPGELADATVLFMVIPLDRWHEQATQGADPEALLRPLDAAYSCIIPEIKTRLGVLDTFVSNAAICVFRDEGHTQRALEAALACRARLIEQQKPGVAVGLTSGLVLFGSVGSLMDGRVDYTSIGDVVNSAISLGSMATPGEILLPASMHKSLLDLCVTEPVDVQIQTGVGTTCDVLRVLGFRTDVMGTARTEAFAVPHIEATPIAIVVPTSVDTQSMEPIRESGRRDLGSTPTNPPSNVGS